MKSIRIAAVWLCTLAGVAACHDGSELVREDTGVAVDTTGADTRPQFDTTADTSGVEEVADDTVQVDTTAPDTTPPCDDAACEALNRSACVDGACGGCLTGFGGDDCTNIDECADGTAGCDDNAICADTEGDFTCTCNAGFEGDGVTCTNIDECATGDNDCGANATCADTVGSFICTCNAGYTGDGLSCDNVDECADGTADCSTNASCSDTDGGFDCTCNAGYSGDGQTCDNVDECADGTAGCDANASCSDTDGGFDCTCNAGYTGDGQSCDNVDECTGGTAGCDINAVCADTDGSFTCTCAAGFAGNGTTCGNIDECAAATDNCNANATCTDAIGTFTCECNEGYSGDGVSCVDIDECATGAAGCDVNATCTNSTGGFDCACNDGFSGDGTTCANIDECATNADNCDSDAVCADTMGGFTCTCAAGFVGDGVTCNNVDECADGSAGCDTNATCADTEGSFVCSCNPGYTGDGQTCFNVVECDTGADDCDVNATCTDTDGAFTCACNAGYLGDGVTCSNVDECAAGTDTCDDNAVCTDTDGSFTCACAPGYTGDGLTCVDIDECSANTDNCAATATCANTDGGFTCTCNDGYTGTGTTCSNVNECVLGTAGCDANATCVDTVGSVNCICNPGYEGPGDTCTDVDECTAGTDNCDANAVCTNTVGSFTCECPDGFTGNGFICINIDECSADASLCENGTCVDTIGGFQCECDLGYLPVADGTACDNNDECAQGLDNCDPVNGTCSNTAAGFDCACNAGYEGDGITCTDTNECADPASCDPNATCTNTVGSFSCACNAGYTGDGTTCTDVDECAAGGTANCDANASCTNAPGSFTCTCDPGYTGDGATCTDVDECMDELDNCDMNATCANTDGSFTCTCATGYAGDGITCSDVDECADGTDTCDTNASCTNTPGAFTCACDAGFVGDGATCTDVDECADGTDNCDANASCTNAEGGFTCACNMGYVDVAGSMAAGTDCELDTVPGDVCADAPTLVVNTPVSGNTAMLANDYSFDSGECTGAFSAKGGGSNDISFVFTAPADGDFTFATTDAGTDFDNALYVVTDCDDIPNTCLGGKDSGGSTGVETLDVTLTAGQVVYVIVDGYSDSTNLTGDFELVATCGNGCTLGATQCNGTAIETCQLDANGCTAFVQTSDCAGTAEPTCAAGACVPPVPGDMCVDAPTLMLNTAVSGNTDALANDYSFGDGECAGSTFGKGGGSNDISYVFTAPIAGDFTFATTDAGTDFDNALYVVSDCDDIANTCLGGVDGGGSSGVETLDVTLTAGQTVYVIVDGYGNTSSQSGDYELIATCGSGCTVGDVQCNGTAIETCQIDADGCTNFVQTSDCAGTALPVCNGGACVMGTPSADTCADATPITASDLPFAESWSTCGYTETNDNATCMGNYDSGQDGFYAVELAVPTGLEITLSPSATYSGIAIDDSCPIDATTCLATVSNSGTADRVIDCALYPAGTYYIAIDTWAAPDCTDYDIAIDTCTPCIPDCTNKDCGDDGCGGSCGTCPAGEMCDAMDMCVATPGDMCSAALPLAMNATVTGTSTDGEDDYSVSAGECPGIASDAGGASDDITYAFTAAADGVYRFELSSTGTDFNSALYVVTDCDDIPNTCLGGGNVTGDGGEVVDVALAAGDAVFVIVDGSFNFSNESGDYELTAGCPPACTVGDVQCNGTVIETCATGANGCTAFEATTDCAGTAMPVCDMGMCVGATPGDLCSNALPITLGTAVTGNTDSMSADYGFGANECVGSTSAKGAGSNDITHTFTAPSTATYTIALTDAGTDFDSALYVVTDCDDIANTCLGGKDATSNGSETLDVALTAGDEVFIIVDGWSTTTNQSGDYELVISCDMTCTAGDTQCNGTAIETCSIDANGCAVWTQTSDCAGTALPQCVSGACSGPPPVPVATCDDFASGTAVMLPADLGKTFAGFSTEGADTYDDTCMGNYDGGDDVLFEVVVGAATNVQFEADGSWIGLGLDATCPLDGSACVATNGTSSGGDSGCLSLSAGTYYLMVSTWPSPQSSSFDLTVSSCTP